jgi:uncharacterized protein (TIGR00288 family)
MTTEALEERIALFLDYENLAIGAREDLDNFAFDMKPLADALAERGRVVVRRAYADWSYFDTDRRMLAEQHVEMIEIPQRMGAVRKNAADIKMAVDAIELCFERAYITTFVIATGDSDFTPLVAKLRELNRSVIGVGLQASTSSLLPPACDEFLFYGRRDGVQPREPDRAPEPVAEDRSDDGDLSVLITQTLSGLKRTAGDTVLGSQIKRTLLRKDPTFDEASYGFRSFGELLRHLRERRVIELREGLAKGDPEVDFPEGVSQDEDEAFALLREVVASQRSGPVPLSGLKNELRKRRPDFTEKRFGYGGFLQFCKAARAKGHLEMHWDDELEDYVLAPAS